MAIYYVLVGVVVLAGAGEVSYQVFFSDRAPSPYATCAEGLRALYGATEEARRAAADSHGEEDALTRFRGALDPTWARRDSIAATCKSPADEALLDAIERLRYAEEHAVRREAGDLAPLRQRVQSLVENELKR
jgi:hypothetical protein